MFRENGDPSNAIPETPANGVPALRRLHNRTTINRQAQEGRSYPITTNADVNATQVYMSQKCPNVPKTTGFG